jgi:hypothetical protein
VPIIKSARVLHFVSELNHVMGKTKNGEASNGATYPDVAPYSVLKVTAGLKISSPAQVQETRPG